MSATMRNMLAILILTGAALLAGCAPSRGSADESMSSPALTADNGAGRGVEDPRG